jgi:hypothetical protein
MSENFDVEIATRRDYSSLNYNTKQEVNEQKHFLSIPNSKRPEETGRIQND